MSGYVYPVLGELAVQAIGQRGVMKAAEPIWTQPAASRRTATLARWIMRERPADGRNQAGLLWLLNGDKVVALTETRVNPEFLAFTPGRQG